PLADEQSQELNAILERRRQVVGMLTAEKNRLHVAARALHARAAHVGGVHIGGVHTRIEAHIEWLETELADIDGDLDRAIRNSPIWRERDDLLRSVPGIGKVVSMTLLAELPEL